MIRAGRDDDRTRGKSLSVRRDGEAIVSLTSDETRVFSRTGSAKCATYASRYFATSSLTGSAYGSPGNSRPGFVSATEPRKRVVAHVVPENHDPSIGKLRGIEGRRSRRSVLPVKTHQCSESPEERQTVPT
jgi:hypothetical protein